MEILVDEGRFAEMLSNVKVNELAEFVLNKEERDANTEVSIAFVSDCEIAELNEQFRGKSGPTDVLSFECDSIVDPDFQMDELSGGMYELGDVIIAPDVAKKQSSEFGNTFVQEIELLLTHGLLHLCGYDHIEDSEAEVMEAREKELLAAWRKEEIA